MVNHTSVPIKELRLQNHKTSTMGGSSSKKQQQDQQQHSSEVQMRKKDKKKKKKERPVSDPGAGAHLDFPSNFSTRPNPDGAQVDLSGRRPAQQQLEQGKRTSEASDQQAASKPSSPRESTASERQHYSKALDNVLLIWPEYELLKEVDAPQLAAPVLQAIQQVLVRLYEQHHMMQKLSREKKEASTALEELKEEHEGEVQQRERLQFENRNLKEDIVILKGELRRRGHNPRLPERRPAEGQEDVMGKEDNGEDGVYDKVHRLEREGIYQATPMMRAIGSPEELRNAVQRNPSQLRKVRPEVIVGREGRVEELSLLLEKEKARCEDLTRRLEREMEERIEAERYRERPSSQTGALLPNRPPLSPGAPLGLELDGLVERYASLENEALGRVAPLLDRYSAPGMAQHRRAAFSGIFMETAYSVAKHTASHLKDTVQSLLLHPTTRPATLHHSHDLYSKLDYPANAKLSKLAQRTRATAELPDNVMNYINIYLQQVSNAANLDPLLSDVLDEVSKDYPDCLTPSVLNHQTFRDFTEKCCRAAWQMNLMVPPPYVSTEYYTRFDDRYHQTYDVGDNTNAKVDYYRWPILLSHKHGDVMHKGLVVLKHSSTL